MNCNHIKLLPVILNQVISQLNLDQVIDRLEEEFSAYEQDAELIEDD